MSIPLTKRSTHLNRDGSVDIGKLQANVHRTITFVFLFALFENVVSLTDRPLRKLDRGFRAYERNTGGPHPLALKRQHSNERRIGVSLSLVPGNNALWIVDIDVGTPGVGFAGQSPSRAGQTLKLIIKCAVEIDTSTADLFLPGISCSNCGGHNLYNPSRSSSAVNSNINATINFSDNSVAVGQVFSENVFVGGFEVGAYWLLVGTLTGD